MSKLGMLVPPYPVEHCANVDCAKEFHVTFHGAETWIPAFLFTDLESSPANKLVVFCEDCATRAELEWRHRFLLVAL
jgi:hypothetical protein